MPSYKLVSGHELPRQTMGVQDVIASAAYKYLLLPARPPSRPPLYHHHEPRRGPEQTHLTCKEDEEVEAGCG